MRTLESLPALLTEAKDKARLLVDVPRELAFIVPGWAYYMATGKTPFRAYQSMRRLFYMTDGRFNDAVSEGLRILRPPFPLDRTSGALGDMQGEALDGVLRGLNNDGFHVFDQRLPDDVVREIHDFALRTPCTPYGENVANAEPVLFDAANQHAPTLHFDSEELLQCSALRKLVVDRSVLAVAQAYLRTRVVMDTPRMWWSTPGDGRASAAGAQQYHFDLDRLKWLNFFFLITDVDTDTGPHCYARESHHRKPPALRKDGRHSDDEIASHYPGGIVEIGGPKGTIFVADTRGFHKGKLLRKGNRLLFQLVLANSLFGQTYRRVNVASEIEPDFSEVRRLYPLTYSSFGVGGAA